MPSGQYSEDAEGRAGESIRSQGTDAKHEAWDCRERCCGQCQEYGRRQRVQGETWGGEDGDRATRLYSGRDAEECENFHAGDSERPGYIK